MKDTIDLLLALACSEMTGEPVVLPEGFCYDFDELMQLSKEHEIYQVVADALIKNDLIKDEQQLESARRLIFHASYRDAKNRYIYELVRSVFEKDGIEYVPLKGSVIKNFYPESWMRTSCDIDILVKKEKLEKAITALKKAGFEVAGNPGYHDVSLLLDDTNLELHFSICEDIDYIDSLLKKVWNYTVKDGEYCYLQTSDFFVYHHIAHMLYHFLSGGCGFRTFLDLWVLRRAGFFDEKAVYELCEKAKISEFCHRVIEATEVWFDKKEGNDLIDRIKKYVADGCIYGKFPNNAAAYTAISGGKVKFIFNLAFPSVQNMRVLYPELNKYPVLLPVCYVRRVIKKLFGRDKRSLQKFEIVKNQDKELIRSVSDLLSELGLKK